MRNPVKHIYKYLLILLFILISSFASAGSLSVSAKTTTKAANDKIIFTNKVIENAVREELGNKKGNLTKSDVSEVKVLSICNSELTDISDLKQLTSLECLILSYNNIDNIDALSGLKKLRILSLYHNSITDISPIKGCTGLEDLDFSYNKVEDISMLGALVNLEQLSFNNNFVKNIKVIKNFTKLEYLQMQDNLFEDISPVLNLKSLDSLSLYNSNIKSYKSLNQLSAQLKYKDFDIEKDSVIADKVTEIINQIITPGMSDYEKELAVHDYIVLHTEYDYENYIKDTIPDESYTPYGVLMKGTGVCAGYARTFKLFMDRLGIECYYVTGEVYVLPKGVEGHAWNIVKIDGAYYQVDTTWDDPVPDTQGKVYYSYMNLDDSQMMTDHSWIEKNYPKCNSVYYNHDYYKRCMESNISFKSPDYITGHIALPQKEVAPKDGLRLKMSLTITNYMKEQKTSYEKSFILMIPEGKNSIDFSVAVPNVDYEYKLNVYVYNSSQYLSGNYTTEGLIDDFYQYTPITPSNNSNIDITLTRDSNMPNVMPYTVSIPKGCVAPAGGLPVKVIASNSSATHSTEIVIPEGKNSAEGELRMQQTDTDKYYLYYTLDTLTDVYINRGYYNTKGMLVDTENADLIQFYNSSEYKLDIIKGNSKTVIKGKLSLPSGEVAPKGGFPVTVTAKSDNNSPENIDDIKYSKKYVIPEGKNSVNYELSVTYAPFGYEVSYSLKDKVQDYVSFGYYNDKGTVTNEELMTKIFASDYTKVNFTISKGCVIEGTISLPSGDKAPAGGITAEIIAMSFNDTYEDATDDFKDSVRVTIPEGKSSVSYSVSIDGSKKGYNIYYNLVADQQSEAKDKYVLSGLGMKSGFVYKQINSSVTKIDFTLVHTKVIKGTISLPMGETAKQSDMNLVISAYAVKGTSDEIFDGGSFNAYATIQVGKNSAEFTLLLPDVDIQYYVKYFFQSDSYGFLPEGIVGDGQMVDNAEKAHIYINVPEKEIQITVIK